MRILLTQRELILRAGSEMFTIDAARALRSRGHEVIVWSARNGDLAAALQSYGVPVHTTLADIPWRPDIVHGQHHLQTMAALAFFQSVPVIYHCHGVPWLARPPRHRLIRHYVVTAASLRDTLETTHGIPPDRISVVNNFVNLERFPIPRPAPPRVRRALVFDNNFAPGAEMDRLRAACQAADLALDTVGLHFGNAHPRPEHLLQEYDLVFAVGKCAIEALASGCAVIPLSPGQAGSLITPENFEKWAASNFGPRIYSPAGSISAAWLHEALGHYQPEAVAEVTRRVRAEYELQHSVALLETVYQQAVSGPALAEAGADSSDLRETGLYLEKVAAEVDALFASFATHHAAHEQMKQRLALGQEQSQADQQALEEAHRALQEEQPKKQALRDKIVTLEHRSRALEQEKKTLARQWRITLEILRRSWLGRKFLSRIGRRLLEAPPAKDEAVDKSDTA